MRTTKTTSNPIVGILCAIPFTIGGLGMLIGAVYWYFVMRKFVAAARPAEGTVISLAYHRSSSTGRHGRRSSGSYHPRVRFMTAEEETVEFESRSGSNPASYKQGEKVTVLYDPANPSDAEISSFMSLWFGPCLLFGMGAVFSVVGVGLTFLFMKSVRAGPTSPAGKAKPMPPG